MRRGRSSRARVSLYLIMTLAGWDTGATAPLLPFLQRYYNVSVPSRASDTIG